MKPQLPAGYRTLRLLNMTLTESADFDAAVLRFLLKMLKFLCVLITIGAIAAGQDVAIRSSPLLRHYTDGQKLTYRMRGINENWHYEIQADGIAKKDSEGTYFEEYGWSHFISDGQAVTLSPASLSFRQQLTLDPNQKPGLPNLAQVDPRLIGPITDFLTFYVDVWLSVRTGKLTQRGDHCYFKQGTPASWADGDYVLLGQSSIDFDFTLNDVNRSRNTVPLTARHVGHSAEDEGWKIPGSRGQRDIQ